MSPAATLADDAQKAELERRERAMARWRTQSRRIHFFRRALPGAMAALLALLVGWIAVRAVLTAMNEAKGAAAAIHMTNAVFHGRNESGRPFVLHAREAVRDGSNVNQIQLTDPIFEMAAEETVGARKMTAQHGLYYDDKKMLYMNGHVVLDDGQGTLFHSETAVIDINKDTARGDSRVVGDGPQGHITASTYSVDQKGQHIVFAGHVQGRFLPQKEQEP